MRFSYIQYAGDGGSPSLEVTPLGTNGVEHETPALIDTGAEWSMLSTELAVRLGADLSDEGRCMPTHSQHAGGTDPAWWWRGSAPGSRRLCLGVRVGNIDVSLAPVLKPRLEIVALGRCDFLAAFKLVVDEREQTFWLEPYSEPADDWLCRKGRMERYGDAKAQQLATSSD
jgi:hypothetical protein